MGLSDRPSQPNKPNAARRKARDKAPNKTTAAAKAKRAYVKQVDVPGASLDEALRVPEVIFENYAGKPTSPINIAKALSVDPKGSQLWLLTGAAIAFGLIEGGAQATTISVTELAKRIVKPRVETDDLLAKREAILRPRIFGEFLRHYDGNNFPKDEIAQNVIEEMGVARAKALEVIERIKVGARSVGYIVEVKEKLCGHLNADMPAPASSLDTDAANDSSIQINEAPKEIAIIPPKENHNTKSAALATAYADD